MPGRQETPRQGEEGGCGQGIRQQNPAFFGGISPWQSEQQLWSIWGEASVSAPKGSHCTGQHGCQGRKSTWIKACDIKPKLANATVWRRYTQRRPMCPALLSDVNFFKLNPRVSAKRLLRVSGVSFTTCLSQAVFPNLELWFWKSLGMATNGGKKILTA